MKHKRTRYQTGSLTIEPRKIGPAVWVFRWRESGLDGLPIKRKQRVGTLREFPSKTAAQRAVDALQIDVNGATAIQPSQTLTVAELAAHYKAKELDIAGNGKSQRTREVYGHQIENVILPRWGTQRLRDVKPVLIESWLRALPLADGSKAKTKSVFSILFQHAMRYEWASVNPVRLARQGSLSKVEQIVLTAVEIAALLQELRNPTQAIVHAAAITGLRRGELFGLKWQDINFDTGEITVVRSMVDQIEGPPKTLASRRPIPMAEELAQTFKAWREQSYFKRPDDWVFASPAALGKKPYWPDAVLKRHILPAAKRAGITKRIGWHSFRRTLATLLLSSGASIKTAQELMRHASPQMTLGVYAKAVTEDKRHAQAGIAALLTNAMNGVPIQARA